MQKTSDYILNIIDNIKAAGCLCCMWLFAYLVVTLGAAALITFAYNTFGPMLDDDYIPIRYPGAVFAVIIGQIVVTILRKMGLEKDD